MLNQVVLLALLLSPEAAPAQGTTSQASARAEAYYNYSVGLQERLAGNVDEALAAYRRAQKLDPEASAIRVETARLLREMGRLDEALQEAHRVRPRIRIRASRSPRPTTRRSIRIGTTPTVWRSTPSWSAAGARRPCRW